MSKTSHSSRSPQKKQAPGVQGVTQVSFDDTASGEFVIRTFSTSNHNKAAGGDRGRRVVRCGPPSGLTVSVDNSGNRVVQHGPVSEVTRVDWESELDTRIKERENAIWHGERNGPKQLSSKIWEGTCAACGSTHKMETNRVTRVYKDESMCSDCKKYASSKMDCLLMNLTKSASPVCFGFYILFGSIVHTQHDWENHQSDPDFSICGHLGNKSLYGNFVMNCKLVEDAHRSMEDKGSLISCLEHHPEELAKKIRDKIQERDITGEIYEASFNPVDRKGICERMEAFLSHEKTVWDNVDERGNSIWTQAMEAKSKVKAAGKKNDS